MNKVHEHIHIAELINKDLLGVIKVSESDELEKWMGLGDNERLYDEIRSELINGQHRLQSEKIDIEKAWVRQERTLNSQFRKVVLQRIIYRAAIVILLLSVGSVAYWYSDFNEESNNVLTADENIRPQETEAKLILADGTVQVLSSDIEEINDQGIEIQNQNRELKYESGNIVVEELLNTLQIPEGMDYHVILADGTKVWLNAKSQLEYPVAFNADMRKVKLSGEAYFEVVTNPHKPFIVETSQQQITVLGTAFNVTAYEDDNNVVTTLVEGKVQASFNNKTGEQINKVLRPSEQLILNNESGTFVHKKVDTYPYVAWKEGYFVFENKPLDEIMKVMARWYDVDIAFDDKDAASHTFVLNVQKYESFDKVMEIIELTEQVKFIKTQDKIQIRTIN